LLLFTVLLSSQLLYYLLVIQTGIMYLYDSQLSSLYTLPIGGVIGSYISINFNLNKIKLYLFFVFFVEFILGVLYPNINLFGLLVLGFSLGLSTPWLLYLFKEVSKKYMMVGLIISYVVGTYFYPYEVEQRGVFAISLALISIVAILLVSIKLPTYKKSSFFLPSVTFLLLASWIFLDSLLFEMISRDKTVDIWNNKTIIIILFHILGVLIAHYFKKIRSSYIVYSLFGLSYIFYFLESNIVLAMIYPFVISIYNYILFDHLIYKAPYISLGNMLIVLGWLASGFGLFIALKV